MRFLLIFIATAFNLSAKTVIIKTDKAIDIKKIKVSNTLSDNYDKSYLIHPIDKKTFSFDTDSDHFYLTYLNSIGYLFENIQNIKEDTIIVNEVKWVRYITADTINTSVTKYKRDSTIASIKSKTEIIRDKNLESYIPHTILVNNKPISGKRSIEQDGNTTWSCTPYKIAYQGTWTGRRITFVYQY